jgi:hypothetical protein
MEKSYNRYRAGFPRETRGWTHVICIKLVRRSYSEDEQQDRVSTHLAENFERMPVVPVISVIEILSTAICLGQNTSILAPQLEQETIKTI